MTHGGKGVLRPNLQGGICNEDYQFYNNTIPLQPLITEIMTIPFLMKYPLFCVKPVLSS